VKRAGALVLVAAGAVACAAVLARGGGGGAHAAVAPTWDDVAPVFAAKCASCHEQGGVAPFSLTSPLDAKAHAPAILRMTRTGAMPPWMPGSDSPPYLGSSRRILTADEQFLIASWVRSGAHLGSARPITPDAGTGGAPGTPITLTPMRAYTPHVISGSSDDYHCMLLDPKLSQDMFVTSAVVKPQRSEIVHHVILFEATGDNAAEARRLDAASGGRGWTCFGGPQLTETRASAGNAASDRLGSPQWISAWVPGHATNDLPVGTGVLLHRDAVIVMQIHYNLLHDGHAHGSKPDRSSATLKLVPAAGSTLTPLDTFLAPAPVELPCPSGTHSQLCSRQAAYESEVRKYGQEAAFIPVGLLLLCKKTMADYPLDVGNGRSIGTSCDRTVNRPIRIYGVAGHMHLRGTDIRIELDPGTPRAETLLHIPHWDFHWQDAYYLEHPVDADPGDTIRVSCRFDNSAAAQPVVNDRRLTPRYVLWGEGTTDEMCLGLLQVATRRP
jgi:copper type II ascorbate-dependent monooxygenase-like protein/cbb3-type cytochrome c oxidase subunit III